MPDGYTNPENKPPVGPFKWVPPGIPKGGSLPNGDAWATLVIERGKFRNDLPKTDSYPNSSVETTFIGDVVSGSKDDPILAAFRYIARPSSVRGPTPSSPFIIKANKDGAWEYKVMLTTKSALSAATFKYFLLVDLTDSTLWPNLTEEDAAKAKAYRPGGDVPQIDWSQYKFAKFTVIDSQGNETEWPSGDKPLEVLATGPSIENLTPESRNITIRFGKDSQINPSDFRTLSGIKISPRYPINSMKFGISKLMLFDAVRVNIRPTQLPCSLLEYAISLQFNYDPAIGGSSFPASGRTPNAHVKIFVPDFVSNSPGLAHSLNLRFLIVSQQITGIDPTGLNNLYFVIVVGPAPGSRTVAYTLSSAVYTTPNLRIVRLDHEKFQDGVKTIRIQKSDAPGDSVPDASKGWKDVGDSKYTIASPPGFDFLGVDGPYVRDFMYLEKTGTSKDWYRIVQTLSDNSEYFGAPFHSDLYWEKTSLRLDSPLSAANLPNTTSIIRRGILQSNKPVLDSLPLVVFVDFSEDRYYSGPVTILQGPWKLRIEGYSADTEAYANTFVYARFWFVPEDYVYDPVTPHKYRDETEFYFDTATDGSTKFVRGTPVNLKQVMVFPPLPNTNTMLEAVRYIDSISGPGTSSGNKFTLPRSFGSKRAKLMIGLYTVSGLDAEGARLKINQTDIRLPSVSLALNNAYNAVETSIYQTLTGAYYPTKANLYDSVNFIALPTPLTVNRSLIGGGAINDSGYAVYSKTFQAIKDSTDSAFSGLATIGYDAQQQIKVCLPFTNIPDKYDSTVFVVADFATDGKTLAQGKVLDGNWEIELNLNADVDTATVACDFKFEAMLVSRNGKVAERIFRSGIISGIVSKSDTIKFSTSLALPFLSNGDDTQLILRVYAFPYARKSPVKIDDLKKKLGSTPLGVRIDSLSINSHTIQRLNFVQTDSKPGSPAWYEDLPLTPAKSLESNEFWFILSPDLQNTQTVSGGVGLTVNGTVYSPAWYLDLPEHVEVETKTASFQNVNFWVRTVLGQSGTTEQGLSAIENLQSGQVHIAHGEPAPAGSIKGDTGSQIRHYVLDNPYQKSSVNTVVQGNNASTPTVFEGRDPNLIFVRRDGTNKSKDFVAVMAHVDETSGKAYNVAINPHGASGTWIGPNHNLSTKNFGVIRKVAEGLEKPAIAMSDNGMLAYVMGVLVDSGALIMREVNLFDAGVEGNLAAGTAYIIDGSPTDSITMPNSEPLLLPKGTLNGRVVETFSSSAITKSGQLIVAYALEGESGKLFARFRNSGQAFSPAIPIVDMGKMGVATTGDLSIYGPALAVHQSTNSVYIAFWCAGKIMLSRVQGFMNTEQGILLSPLQLVSGSKDFSKASAANGAFLTLQNSGNLLVSQYGTIENDVPQQRVGVFVSEHAPYQGSLFVYYFNADNKLCSRQIKPDSTVGAPIIIE